MKFIIDRRFWSRGPSSYGMLLLGDQIFRNKCCLGFIAQQCGIEDALLDTVPVPQAIEPLRDQQMFQQFADPYSDLVSRMIDLNDSMRSDTEIEQGLKDLVSTYTNHELEFIN